MADIRTRTGEKSFRCKICRKSFRQGCSLNRHMKTHRPTVEKPYTCQVCKKSFTESHNLKRHMMIHTGERPYKCQLCQKSFAQIGHLKAHLRSHTGEKPYKCQLCQKAFADSCHLKRHTRTHTGEKQHKCQLCQKTFVESGQLKVHMRTHTGEKPYRCELCKKSFKAFRCLKKHTITHNMSSFKCEASTKTFRKLGDLKSHRRTHATDNQQTHRKLLTKRSSSAKHLKLYAVGQSQDLALGSEVIANMSDHFIMSSGTDVIDNSDERFSKNIFPDSSRIVGHFPKTRDGDSFFTDKFKSHLDAKMSLSRSFGCGICNELFGIEKEFLEHCSDHLCSPPDDLAADLFCKYDST